jgi:nitroreductase
MSELASSDNAIQSVLSLRRSPYAIDPNKAVSETDLQALFEAARWSASASNVQPWRYVVGVKGRQQATWDKVFEALLAGNQPWAKNAPVLALGIAQTHLEHNGKPNGTALHDLGAASASLTVEATARGLHVHQMAGLDPQRAHASFGLDKGLVVLTAIAIGYAGAPEAVAAEYFAREAKPRLRKPLNEIVLAGGF